MAKSRIYFWRGVCGFLLVTCLVSCLLLIINSFIVHVLYEMYASSGPQWITLPKVGQSIVLITPVLMLLGQWWLYDKLVDYLNSIVDSETSRESKEH